LGNRADAEDVAQDALLAAFSQASSFRGRSTVRSWLYAIAKNAARVFQRSRVRRRVREQSGARPGAAPDPSETWARELLARLPEIFREVLLLCDVNGFTYEEAAEALRCPVKTVSTRLFRARERMAKFLEERELT
jgi:RNA polymerase sigma factor (sigma-70 family)